jgi:hypothetical protein
MVYLAALAAATFLASVAISVPTISVVGSKFFDNAGNQFFVKGMEYYSIYPPLRPA